MQQACQPCSKELEKQLLPLSSATPQWTPDIPFVCKNATSLHYSLVLSAQSSEVQTG